MYGLSTDIFGVFDGVGIKVKALSHACNVILYFKNSEAVHWGGGYRGGGS